ncbi:transcriptional regulator [Sediminicola sp. YIK13]|uniref:response regulator n=1 Tax=Sediminicola sp. YIK13 TaxID=1453352 RepID=UPI000721CC83|nr:response regulator [Sediminicola sp. YIK13]ALM09226.1 transcriptional regulator [Sediminicola sp. YIK13]
MYEKVLVAEDIDSISMGVDTILKKLRIKEIQHTSYCDDAYLKAKRAQQDGSPYQLLISDLSFKPDYREAKLSSGQELIAALKKEQPNLKVIVYSIEDHPQVIKSLWKSGLINGFVAKDRKGLEELKAAITNSYNNDAYISPQLAMLINQKNVMSLGDFEIQLMTSLANGHTQDEIERHFKANGISPSSKSSIEKRIKELKEDFQANTTAHLVSILKDLRLI